MKIKDFFTQIRQASTSNIILAGTVILFVIAIAWDMFFSGTPLGEPRSKGFFLGVLLFTTTLFFGVLIVIRKEYPFMPDKNLLEGNSAVGVGLLIILVSVILLIIAILAMVNAGSQGNPNIL